MDRSSPAAEFDPRVLVEHVDFVRRLARGLVPGADAADELAAETFAAAVTQRPATGPAFRGWLRRVASRLVRREVIADERRVAREQIAARAERDGGPDAAEIAERLELERALTVAFAALDEPYRSTLFRRYWRDLAPAQIAAETATPVATVKSRLQRGLAQLRERLDAMHGGSRERWLAALLPWISIGGPAVTVKSKVVPVALAALVVVGASVAVMQPWKLGDRERPEGDAMPQPAAVAAASAPESDRAAPPAPSPERTPAPPDPAPLPFASGLVVDASGSPLAGVDVIASRLDRRPNGSFPIEQRPLQLDRLERDRLTTSDAMGRFVIAEPGEDLASLLFLRPGFALAEWSELSADRAQNQERTITLAPGRRIRGRTVDTAGEPVPFVLVRLSPALQGNELPMRKAKHLADAPEFPAIPGMQHATSDARGAFAFESISPGPPPSRLLAMAGGYAAATFTDESLTDPCELVLTRNAVIVDVADADTGEPLRAALLAIDAKTGAAVEQVVPWDPADVERSVISVPGRLLLHTGFGGASRRKMTPLWLQEAADGKCKLVLQVVAAGYLGEIVDVEVDAEKEPPHLHVELVPAEGTDRDPAIAGRVVGGTKAKVSLFRVLPGWDQAYLERAGPLLAASCDADGSFRFFDLPDGRYRIAAQAEHSAPAWTEVDAPAHDVTIELVASGAVVAKVKRRDGNPAGDVVVHVQVADGSRAWSARTDAAGVAKVEGLPPATYRIGAFEDLRYDLVDASFVHPQAASVFPDERTYDVASGEQEEVELRVVERVPVRFHVERDDGSPVLSARFAFHTFDGPVQGAYNEINLLRGFRLDLDANGNASASLYPGSYTFGVSELTEERSVTFVVRDEPDASVTIRLPNLGPTGELEGRLIELGSRQPIARRKVFAIVERGGDASTQLGLRQTDDEGRFRFEHVPAGSIRLAVYAASIGDGQLWLEDDPTSPYGYADQRVEIKAGRRNDVEIALPAVRAKSPTFPTIDLRARITDASTGQPLERAMLVVRAQIGPARITVADLQTDEAGRVSASLYAADAYSIEIWGPWDSMKGTSLYEQRGFERTPAAGELRIEEALELRKR